MKLEQKFTIGGDVVEEVTKTKTLTIYRSTSSGEDKHYVVNTKTGEVEFYMDITTPWGDSCGSIDINLPSQR